MDAHFIKEFLSFAASDDTRAVLLTGLVVGLIIGFAGGVLFSKWLYLGVRGVYRAIVAHFAARHSERERKERECEENRKRFGELRRIKKSELEEVTKRLTHEAAVASAMDGLVYNHLRLLEDCDGNYYCAQCIKKPQVVLLRDDFGTYVCPACGVRTIKHIYAHH